MGIKLVIGATLALSTSVLALEAAHATTNIVSGTIWEVTTAQAQNATINSVPPAGATAGATFLAPSNPLSFTGDTTASYTLGGFLASGGATNVNFFGGATAGDNLNSTLMEVTGSVTVTSGETFGVGHDDGFSLRIGGWLDSTPGPTSFIVTPVTYTGPSGTFAFKLAYGECCGPPAFLTVDLPLSSVPEPSTWAMMGLGFAGLGFFGYRARKTRVLAI